MQINTNIDNNRNQWENTFRKYLFFARCKMFVDIESCGNVANVRRDPEEPLCNSISHLPATVAVCVLSSF